jgi:diguanylate cyclase (GGDEF)-like protein
MVRLTRKVFSDLAIWMIGFGLLMGIIFPFFVRIMGVPATIAFRLDFFGACLTAGFLVGAVNIGLTKLVVGRRWRLLADRLQFVQSNLQEMAVTGNAEKCTPEVCRIPIDSEDEIGETAQAFNHLVEALAFSHQTDAAVRSFTDLLSSQLELETLTNQALHQLIKHTEASAGAILVETEGELKVACSHGIRSPRALLDSDHIRRALRTENRLAVSLPEDVTLEGVLTDFRPRQVLVDPVLYKQVPLGVSVLASSTIFTNEVQSRLDLFSRGLGLALNNALAHDRLQKLAALDPLTGIYNRRFGMTRFHEEFGRAVRGNAPLGILIFDIDHFKKVNDTYGHLGGDRVLTGITKTTRSVMREGDVLVRYGGEEFLAILPAASKKDVLAVGERLRRMIEEMSIRDGDQEIHVTISIGATSYPELNVGDDQELLKQADNALYLAKESGRNRVFVA